MIAPARALLLSTLAIGAFAVLPTRSAAAVDEPLDLPDPPARSPLESDFADPFVLRDGETYYAFATGVQGCNVQVARSRDLKTWVTMSDALPSLPPWAARQSGLTWAPSVLRRPHGYVLYYTTADTTSGFQCISRARASRPEGPYIDDSPRPFVCQVGAATPFCGSIDPSPFVDHEGRAFLLWKSDENSPACGSRPRIWSQALSDDGMSLVDSPSMLLETDQGWEGPLVEGPSMIRDGDRTLLFYSANWYESASYAVGWAHCDSPVGPCRKMTLHQPLVASSKDALGPGGQELFTDALGQAWMAYHAWSAPHAAYAAGGARTLRLARLTFANGTPALQAGRGDPDE